MNLMWKMTQICLLGVIFSSWYFWFLISDGAAAFENLNSFGAVAKCVKEYQITHMVPMNFCFARVSKCVRIHFFALKTMKF